MARVSDSSFPNTDALPDDRLFVSRALVAHTDEISNCLLFADDIVNSSADFVGI